MNPHYEAWVAVTGGPNSDFVHWAIDTETPETAAKKIHCALDLRDFSAATPYEFSEVRAASQQLIAFGKLG